MENIDWMGELEDDVALIASDAIREFQTALESKKLILTEDLKRNFHFHILRSAQTWAIEIQFLQYGRFKDMAQLHYSAHQAPVDAMEFFVEKRGLDRFAYVPGYKGQSVPTVPNAVKRLAWAIAIGRKKVPSVKRGYRGTWYNSSKMVMINRAKAQLRWKFSLLLAHSIKGTWGKPDDDRYRQY